MQVERPQYGGQSPDPMARVHSGVELTPDQAGATRWRQVQQLAQAGQGFSESLIAEAQRRTRDEDLDVAFNQNRIAKERINYLDRSKAIFDKKGEAAKDAPAEMEALLKDLRTAGMKDLTVEQGKMFAQSWRHFHVQSMAEAERHRETQLDWFKREAPKVSIAAITEESKAKGAKGGIAAVLAGGYADVVRWTTEKMVADYPQELRQQAVRDNVRAFHMEQVKNFAVSSPQTALDYLEASGMKETLDEAQYEALSRQLTAGAIEVEQKSFLDASVGRVTSLAQGDGDAMAVFAGLVKEVGPETATLIAAGYPEFRGVAEEYAAKQYAEAVAAGTEAEAGTRDEGTIQQAARARRESGKANEWELAMRDDAYAGFAETYAKMTLDAYTAKRLAVRADTAVRAMGREKALSRELEEAGNDATRMPSWKKLPIEEQRKYLEEGKQRAERVGPPPAPSLSRWLELMELARGPLVEMLNDPETRAKIVKDLGSYESKPFAEMVAHVDPATPARMAREGGTKALRTMLGTICREQIYSGPLGDDITEAQRQRLDAVLNDVVSEVEAAQRKHGVDSPDKLPSETRQRIMAKATLTIWANESGRDAGARGGRDASAKSFENARDLYSDVELQGLDASFLQLSKELEVAKRRFGNGAPDRLKAEQRRIMARFAFAFLEDERGRDALPEASRKYFVPRAKTVEVGGKFYFTDIPDEFMPEEVRLEQRSGRGEVMRSAADGSWLVKSRNGERVVFFSQDGKNPYTSGKKQDSASTPSSLDPNLDTGLREPPQYREMFSAE